VTVRGLRGAGLTRAAARTLLAFLVVLYSVFLASIVVLGRRSRSGWWEARARGR
jgi:hypothetical protein